MSLPAPATNATVLITGASAGIGAELARQLAALGHNLTLVARRKPKLDELAEQLRLSHGIKTDVRKADLANQSQRTRLINSLRDGDVHVSGVCNNAGFGTYGRFQELALEREAEEVRLNVNAVHELTGAFLPEMVRHGAGAILNIASLAAFQPIPTNATYAATKAFVLSFSEAVHTDLAGTGVSCTALCPGPVRTEFTALAGIGNAEELTPDFVWKTAAEAAAAGVQGMIKGRRTMIPGLPSRVVANGGRIVPRSLLLPLAARFGYKRLMTTS